MVISLDKTSQWLASHVISQRKIRGWTQAQLAKVTGMTRASIALIESGGANPTLENLMKISTGLNISLNEILSRPHANCELVLSKDVPRDPRSRRGSVLKKLLPASLSNFEFDELELEAGKSFKGSPHNEGTKEFFTCTQGVVSIGVLGQLYHLKKGDVLAFPGHHPHSYSNQGRGIARGVSTIIFV